MAERLTKKEVERVAGLANLPLEKEELADFEDKLSKTIDYIHHLNEVATTGIEPTYQAGRTQNRFREDRVGLPLSQEQALQNARRAYQGFFVAQKVWD